MSDTVLIALITFASGIFGSLVGYFASRHASKMELRREAMHAMYERRANAYVRCTETLLDTARELQSAESLHLMITAFGAASLFASEQTMDILAEMRERVVHFNQSDIGSFDALELELFKSFRSDLSEFSDK